MFVNDLRSILPNWIAILAKSNMAAIQLDVNHTYTTRLINDFGVFTVEEFI